MSIRCLCYTVIKTLFHCVTAHLHTKICSDVLVEPHLQPVPLGNSLIGASVNMLEGARLDDAMNGFWGGRYNRTFVDIRVFNPHAESSKTSFFSIYLKHESEKRRMYEQRVWEVERASFVPIIVSATGGMGKHASLFYKQLVPLLPKKRETIYSTPPFFSSSSQVFPSTIPILYPSPPPVPQLKLVYFPCF